MHKIFLHIILLLPLFFHGFVQAQGLKDKSMLAYEKVDLFTERNLFIAGEKVHFSAFLFPADEAKQKVLSHVLYCEIITPDGNKIAGGKYQLSNNSTYGCMEIPKDISTGLYYFRAYTKYMRNRGPYSYNYTRLKIVNPFRSNVLSGNIADKDSILVNRRDKDGSLAVSVEKGSYIPGEIVNVLIKQGDTTQRKLKGYCLSVVPETSEYLTLLQVSDTDHFINKLYNYPESRGLSITGKISDDVSGTPIAGIRINLSIIGKGRDFMAYMTDTAGRFYFSLPAYTGYRDIFLSAANTPSSNPKIQVDNDFCSLPVHLPSPVFTLSEQERQTAYNMAVNLQLSEKFSDDTLPAARTDERMDKAFYGRPSEILNIDTYVLLPSLEEYFNELPTMVKVRKRQGQKYFKVFGSQDALSVFDPLVMLDWVAVDDPEKILAVSPQDISRIEIVNEPYIKGDQMYGGIISIISRRSDFAGIDLPSSGLFINYRFLSDTNECMIKSAPALHQPDTRNTLFWQPQMSLNNGIEKVTFRAPEIPGKYLIVLKGVTNGGKILTRSIAFESKPAK